MTVVESFKEPLNKGHWDFPPLTGYIYKNVIDSRHLINLKTEILRIVNESNKVTFLTNTAIFKYDNKNFKLGSNAYNNRYQNVLYDLSLHPEYWYQTNSTIYDWGLNIINNTLSPNFLKFIHKMLNLHPFNDKKYIPYRLHLNYLPTNEGLGMHVDCNPLLFKEEFENVNQYSLTFYAENHINNQGGELFTSNGWVYRPVENTAIAINGHQVAHGVTYNVNSKPRLAFTTRWAGIDSLFLPGHPDKHVWKVNI